MRQLIGKSCKITIQDHIKNKVLFYTVKEVVNVSDTHISFIDKYNKILSFRLLDVLQV